MRMISATFELSTGENPELIRDWARKSESYSFIWQPMVFM
jgi:hypothetical protein